MGTKTIEDEIKDLIYRFSTNNNLNCGVKDLTHLKTYTIDDSKTVEIDDAISYLLSSVSNEKKLLKDILGKKEITYVDIGTNVGNYLDFVKKNFKIKQV